MLDELNEYRNFIYDSSNIINCDKCPHNNDDTMSKLPCGQQNCWVKIHCERNDNYDI